MYSEGGREGEHTLICSRRAVAMLVCMSILFFFSISSGSDLRRAGRTKALDRAGRISAPGSLDGRPQFRGLVCE